MNHSIEEEIELQTTELIKRDFDIVADDKPSLSEAELLEKLADYLVYMIEGQMEYLLSLMYRLDIDEAKINEAISPFSTEAPNIGLAKLIIERQKQRAFTKVTYKTTALDDNDEFKDLSW